MANSIATAVAYVNNADVINALYAGQSTTQSWEKPCKFIGAKTIKIQQISLGSSVLGTYDRATGYVQNDITTNWVEKTLTQDKGDVLKMDRMDEEESDANTLVSAFNRYKNDIEIPAIDTYRYATVIGTDGVHKTEGALNTAANLVSAIKADIVYLKNLKAFKNAELRISETKLSLLQDSLEEKAQFTYGTGIDADTKVLKYRGATVISVPDDELGCAYILCSPLAVSAQRKYQETVYRDSIPGFGNRMMSIETGVYHDCYVEPGCEQAVCFHTGVAKVSG